MKRGTESRVFLGKDTSIDEFTGINVLSTVLLGKKEGGFKDHNGLFIASNVTLGKGIARVITVVVYGTSPLSLPNAIEADVVSLKAFGGTEQETETIIQTATAQGKTEQRNLPDGYTQLEYIESTGTQYIDTGVIGIADSEFELDVQQTEILSGVPTLLGALNANDATYNVVFGYGSSSRFYTQVGADTYDYTTFLAQDTNRHVFRLTTGETSGILFEIDDQSISGTYALADAGLSLYLCARHREEGTSTSNFTKQKVYSLKIWKNGNLMRNFVPCKNSDNDVGMYDTVSDTFFENQGTGDFVAGPTAVPTPDVPINIVSNNGALKARHQSGLPLGYTLLDYIKSTSRIPLGFYTNQNSEIEAKWYKDGTGSQYAYQANSGSALTNNTTAYVTDGGGYWRFGNQAISITVPLYTDILSIQNKNGVWFNNEQQGTYTNVNDFTGDEEFKALGNPSTGYDPMIRISYIKHRQNGVLLGHYVPCVAPDNSIGFYDLIGGVFYTNAEATFTAGNTVSDPVEIYTDGTVETITDALSNTATAEMLLKVGDYQDEQEILSGIVTRNVGVLVLDGTEEIWGTQSQTPEYVSILSNCYTIAIPLDDGPIDKRRVYCTHLTSSDTLPDANARQGYALLGNGGTGTPGPLTSKYAVGLGLTTRFPTIAGLKQWLAAQYAAGTPVIIVYPLATATTETVTGQNLRKEPLTVTGSLHNLLVNTTTTDAVPIPEYPLDIISNNGVLKVNNNLWNSGTDVLNKFINDTGEIGDNTGSFYSALIPVKPNTEYTFYRDTGAGSYPRIHAYDSNGDWLAMIAKGEDTYALVISGTTTATTAFIRVTGKQASDTRVYLTDYLYNTIYTDGTVETINVHGENLANFVSGNIVLGYAIDNSTGQQASNPSIINFYCPQYIPVQGGESYVFCGRKANNTLSRWNRIHWYDSSKTFISTCSYTPNTVTIATAPANAAYARISCNPLDNGVTLTQVMVDAFNWVFQKGTAEPVYTPYYNGGTATAEMLLKVGDYQDVQSIIDGVVTRNIEVKVFDGTENWGASSTYQGSCWLNLPTASRAGICVCSHFANVPSISTYARYKVLNEGFAINLWYGDNRTTAVADLKAFLAQQYANGTPVILLRALTTSTTEPVTGQEMATMQGDNTAEITQASMDGLTLEVTYLAGATVTIQEVENAQLSDDVDVTIH